jgi:hypothetical protein
MSTAECAQLRQCAAEAGLTVSAYLRSCTFEVEALRAQVKDALAELRSAPTPAQTPESAEAPAVAKINRLRVVRNWFAWLLGLGPRVNPMQQHAARA